MYKFYNFINLPHFIRTTRMITEQKSSIFGNFASPYKIEIWFCHCLLERFWENFRVVQVWIQVQ